MRIEITVNESHPPSGIVTVDGGDGQAFSGWLGLMHILGRALDPDDPAGSAQTGADPTADGVRNR